MHPTDFHNLSRLSLLPAVVQLAPLRLSALFLSFSIIESTFSSKVCFVIY